MPLHTAVKKHRHLVKWLANRIDSPLKRSLMLIRLWVWEYLPTWVSESALKIAGQGQACLYGEHSKVEDPRDTVAEPRHNLYK